MSEPAALQPWRVPRSTLDENFAPALPPPALTKVTGVVVSVEIDTCTVLVSDEEIGGVILQQYVPSVGDVVEIERRGDLWVLVDFLVDTYIEGGNADAWHVVDDSSPALPDAEEIQIAGSMRDPDAWKDESSGRWTVTWDQSAALLTQVETVSAALTSNEVFELAPGDDITITLDFTVLRGAPTVKVRLYLATVEESAVAPGDPDTQVYQSGALTYTLGNTAQGTYKLTVPDKITTTGNKNEGRPILGRINLLVEQSAATNGIVRIEQVRVFRDEKSFPIGSVWFNPTVAEEPPSSATSPSTTSGDIPASLSWTEIPDIYRVQLDSPGVAGLFLVFWTGHIYVRTATGSSYPEIATWNAKTSGLGAITRANNLSAVGYFPFSLTRVYPVAADGSLDLTLAGRYGGSVPATLSRVENVKVTTLFLPNGVTAGNAFVPARRYWDGNSWRPYGSPTEPHTITTSPPAAKVNSTTTVSRSPASLAAGSTVTITATASGASGTPTGTVTFYRATSASGPWTSLGSKTLSGGSATMTWTATAGTWYFKAVYGGSSAYNSSEGVSASCAVSAAKVEKTKTVSASWVQAYNGSGNQISGSGNDSSVHQGYYSSTHGNRKSLLRFSPNLPADAEVTKVQLICSNWAHWYYNAGGTLRVGWHSKTSKPSTWDVGSGSTAKSSHSVGEGSWTVNISSWANAKVEQSSFAGITIGPGDGNSLDYYGYAAAGTSPWSLKITYLTAT